ncbi:hypothetical protein [Weissella tructae]
MENFMPTNLQGWVVVVASVLGILGIILKSNIKDPLDRVSSNLEKLENHMNKRLDEHDDKLQEHDIKLAEHGKAIKYLEKGNK